MIDIFALKNETNFFSELCATKMAESKFREVVHISSLFPEILGKIESCGDFVKSEMDIS